MQPSLCYADIMRVSDLMGRALVTLHTGRIIYRNLQYTHPTAVFVMVLCESEFTLTLICSQRVTPASQ